MMASSPASFTSSPRILFADPHPLATPIQQWFASRGPSDIVHDGDSALQAFTRALTSKRPYTAVVVAADLPSQSGFALLDAFRQLEAKRDTVGLKRAAICVTSTTPSWSEGQRVFRNAGDAYLPLPHTDDAPNYLAHALRFPSTTDSSARKRHAILLVEDHALQAKMTLAALKKHGCTDKTCTLHHASSLEAALHVIEQTPPKVILLDLTLPDSQGRDTFTAITEKAPSATILILSGSDDEALNEELIAQGARAAHNKRDLNTPMFRQTLADLDLVDEH